MIHQTFPIIYQDKRFLVDPDLFSKASQKFQDMISNNKEQMQNSCLKITFNIFEARNISNFLKICQNQETDVQNSELKEICLLAKMFKAEQIFNTAYNFIQKEIDANYFIPSDQLKEISQSQNLIFETETSEEPIFLHCDINDLEFEESCEQTNDKNNNNNKSEKKHSVCYQIKIENPILKCHHFYLLKDGKVIFSAKQKYDEIFIGEEENCHIKENLQQNVAKITRDFRGYNIVNTNDQEFKIRYLKKGGKFLVKTSFDHQIGKQFWRPRETNCDNMLKGEYNHKVMQSRKNVVLQNHRNHPAFILRKMSKKIYEIECHPIADPIVIFAIALSQIIGPIAM